MKRRTDPTALARALRCRSAPPLPLQRLLPALERQQQTKLHRAMLEAGQRVTVGLLSFRHAFTDQEAEEHLARHPHALWLRLGHDLWSQEVPPGVDSDPALHRATT
jgi:hypothetical protein